MDEQSPNPKDPRVVFAGRHRERGRAKYSFTYEDLARVANVSVKTVRNAAVHHADLDPHDLESIIGFVLRRRPDLVPARMKSKPR